ncbi:MAG: LytR family transcriptional regulator [Ruminococcus sp.]|nr:LytR family transcriptional regulator [Ruminococcus sp.]
MSEHKKKKTGSIAIPFLVTIFIGLILVGSAAFFIYQKVRVKEKTPSKPSPRSVDISVSPEDSHTVLFIYDDPETGKASTTFLLMRSVPYKKEILFIGIPSNAICYSETEKAQVVLKEAYERGGAPAAVSFVEQILDFKFEHYMVLNKSSFMSICDFFGGSVDYPVDIDFNTFTGDGSIQKLGSADIIKYLTYSKFSGGEADRAFKTASLMCEMVNGTSGAYIAENIDTKFSQISSSVSISNITDKLYNKYSGAVKYMFTFGIDPELGKSIAFPWKMDGTNDGKYFIPSTNVRENIPEEYFGEPKE